MFGRAAAGGANNTNEDVESELWGCPLKEDEYIVRRPTKIDYSDYSTLFNLDFYLHSTSMTSRYLAIGKTLFIPPREV